MAKTGNCIYTLIQIKVGHGGPGSCLRTENFLTPLPSHKCGRSLVRGGEDLSSRLTHLGEPSPALPMVIVMTQVPPMGGLRPHHSLATKLPSGETGVGTCWEVFQQTAVPGGDTHFHGVNFPSVARFWLPVYIIHRLADTQHCCFSTQARGCCTGT